MNNKKRILFPTIIIIIIAITITSIIIFDKNDGMENKGVKKIAYRTYTKKNGWSKWTKNGLISGDKKNKILNVQIKYPKNNISYSVYNPNRGWINDLTSIDKTKNMKITGIQFDIYRNLMYNYDICYRSHNSTNKWLGWTCNGQINGNADEEIDAIQVKIIPKNVAKNDYLRNFNSSATSTIGFNRRK